MCGCCSSLKSQCSKSQCFKCSKFLWSKCQVFSMLGI